MAIHERLIEQFGGPAAVRDMGMLESALYRPQSGYYDDLVTMAATLFESLLKNHPFVDGNKRAAFFMTDIFLRLNGYRLDVQPNSTHAFIVGLLETKQADLDEIRGWIETHIGTINNHV